MFEQPSDEALKHSNLVLNRIREEIQKQNGFLSFSDYMQLALYAPGLGYYAAGATKFGPAGDFVTASEILKQVEGLNRWFPVLAAASDDEFHNVISKINQCPETLTELDCRAAYILYCSGERDSSPLKCTNRILDLCLLLEKYCDFMHTHAILDAELIMKLFEKCDAIRQPQRFSQLLTIIEAVPSLVSTTFNKSKADWENVLQATISVNAQDLVSQALKGPAIGAALRKKRVEKIAESFSKVL